MPRKPYDRNMGGAKRARHWVKSESPLIHMRGAPYLVSEIAHFAKNINAW